MFSRTKGSVPILAEEGQQEEFFLSIKNRTAPTPQCNWGCLHWLFPVDFDLNASDVLASSV